MSATKQPKHLPQQTHLFQLKGNNNLYLKQTISVNFSPVKAIDDTLPHQKIIQFSILPTFNPDKKYYSNAFITEYHGLDDDNKMMIDHQTRVKQLSQIDQDKILLPKPRHQKPYCCVCCSLYQDYLEHVESQMHLKALNKNKYCLLTRELVDKFKNKGICKGVKSSQRIKQRQKERQRQRERYFG